jgi:hypothetical protein
MIEYYATLPNIPNTTDFNQAFTFGSIALNMRFFWCEDVQAEYDLYAEALKNQAKADPLLRGADILREYDWLTLYSDTIPHTDANAVGDWMASTGLCPQSLKDLYAQSPALAAQQVYQRCLEADELKERLRPYRERLVWNVEITDDEGDVFTGVVIPGGWINNQGARWRIQFESDRILGRNELALLTINCEVADESAV